jgi:Family of unknown function (DUF5990)
MTAVIVEIRGTDLPGRSCDPVPGGSPYQNVHVGVKHRTGVLDLVRGDAPSARWEVEVTVRDGDDGGFDFGGPFVMGRRGERHLGLCWGTVGKDGSFALFRAAKLRFSHLDPALVERALGTDGRLVASLGLTDQKGHPRCATVKPPDVVWSVTR